MKRMLFITAVLACVFISGCKKSNETDYASNWVGIYNGPNSTGSPGTTSVLNNIIITEVNGSTMRVQIKALETNYLYTLTTLQTVSLNGLTIADIDEVQGITESTGKYHIKGTLTMTGANVTLTATATNIASTQETDVRALYFSGTKNK